MKERNFTNFLAWWYGTVKGRVLSSGEFNYIYKKYAPVQPKKSR